MSLPDRSMGVSWRRPLVAALVCSGLLATAAWYLLRWRGYPCWLAGSGLATFVLYGWDKLAAAKSWRRTPERSLWLMILVGGVFGGWIGQLVFRHKTRKWTFWLVLLLASIIHGALVWFLWQHTR